MARSKTTFGKLVCKGCNHKIHLGEICQRKDCSCTYPDGNIKDSETIALPNGKVENINDIHRAYIKLQISRATDSRYIPKVKIKPPKIEHKNKRKPAKSSKSEHPAGQRGKLSIVEHKSTLGKAANGKTPSIFKDRRRAA